jgi:hypothetical protein
LKKGLARSQERPKPGKAPPGKTSTAAQRFASLLNAALHETYDRVVFCAVT